MKASGSTSQIAWQGESWRLRVDSYRLSDGYVIEKGFIEHPGAVVLVPALETNLGPEILMLRQYRQALKDTILELPAGTRGWSEEWLACAQRELREETGFRADHFAELGSCWPAPGISNEKMAIYLATSLHEDPLPQDADEEITVEPVLLKDLVEMALDGRIQDAKSVVGILRAERYLRKLRSVSDKE
ncbi:MAG: NUDIX hydrolase [Candidatus Promineifilaceae bacterium]|nr:NUDIX hydrolase [Candidatus Promineifilaceae bacterium]